MTAFDPADWLERYTAAGGWYMLASDGLHFGWPVPAVWAAMATREVYREIEDQPERLDAIKALVRERCLIA